jgi:membrane protease YdiL (CAAX protease family)
VLFSSFLFGVAHAQWLLRPEIPWQTSVANIVYAALAGVGFAAVVLRTRSIWLVAAVHAGIAFANWLPALLTRGDIAPATALITTPAQAWLSAGVSILACVPLFLYGLWLLGDITRLDLTSVSAAADASTGPASLPQGGAPDMRSALLAVDNGKLRIR